VVSSAHLTENDSTSDVGRPTAGKYWVVDPTDVDKLAPLGAIGECVIEGLHATTSFPYCITANGS